MRRYTKIVDVDQWPIDDIQVDHSPDNVDGISVNLIRFGVKFSLKNEEFSYKKKNIHLNVETLNGDRVRVSFKPKQILPKNKFSVIFKDDEDE